MQRRLGATTTVLLAIMLVAWDGCGGGGGGPSGPSPPSPDPPQPPSSEPEPNTAHISPENGGVLVTEDGRARVSVPPGAVRDSVTIFADRLSTGETPNVFLGNAPFGFLWRFGPEGLRFQRPVEVTLTVENLELPPGQEAFPITLYTVGLDGDLEVLNAVARLQASRAGELVPAAASVRGLISHFSPFSKGIIATDLDPAVGLVDGFGRFRLRSVFPIDTDDGDPVARVLVANFGATAARSIRIRSEFAQATGIARILEVRFDKGSVTDLESNGFTWEVGTLGPNERAELDVFFEPVAEGVDVHRLRYASENSVGEILVEEPLAVVGDQFDPIKLSLRNVDGAPDAGGVFQSAREVFSIGEAVTYQVIVTNESTFAATGVSVMDEVSPDSGVLRFREIRPGFPTAGAVTETGTGFTWAIGTLGPGQSASIEFRADAVTPGTTVNHVTYQADQLPSLVIDREPTTVVR